MKKRPLPPRIPSAPPWLPEFGNDEDTRAHTYWFSRRGCVVLRANGRRDVFVGAAMVGGFEAGDFAMRNVLLVTVADDERVVLVDLARAFGLVPQSVTRIRKQAREEGLVAVVNRHYVSRGAWKVTPAMERKVVRLFEKGLNQKEARTKLEGVLSAGTLNKLHQKWKGATVEAEAAARARAKEGPQQPELSFESALEREQAPVSVQLVPVTVLAEETKQECTEEPSVSAAAAVVSPAVTLTAGTQPWGHHHHRRCFG